MTGFRFGVAVREITPTYPVWLHGYSSRSDKSDGVAEPICLSCLAIGNGSRSILVVACDLIGIQTHVCAQLYELIKEGTGIGYPYILLSCSHTHFAPALHAGGFAWPHAGIVDPDPRFVADFECKLVEAARESLRNMPHGHLEVVRTHAPQVLFNRRTATADGSVHTNFLYPSDRKDWRFGPVDDELTVLRVTDETGVRAVLVNFGCHPVTGGRLQERDHYRISADYPYYLRRTIADAYGCPVLFTLGAAGDAVPINRYGESRQRIGGTLGNTALLAERMYAEDESTDLRAHCLEVEVSTILRPEHAAAEKEYEKARSAFARILGDSAPSDTREYREAAEAFNTKMMELLRSRIYPENSYTVPVHFLQIGTSVLVGLPFEVLSQISLEMKARFPHSILVSCAGGYQGYLPPEYEYDRGGYEASAKSTHFMPGTADRLLETILVHLGQLG
jgi:hypothetical protein